MGRKRAEGAGGGRQRHEGDVWICWTILALGFANVVSVLGWGDWFPWAVPVLVSGMVKTHAELVGLHSYAVVIAAFFVGLAATFVWWQSADQTR